MFKLSEYTKRTISIALVACAMLFAIAYPALAATAPSLGTAERFAVLADQTVTNTGPTVVNGDLGVSPGTAVVGFPPGTVNGEIHAADATAAEAQADAQAAYNDLSGQACDENTDEVVDLAGLTFTPGVYCFDAILLNGTVTLNAQDNPNAVFIFKTDETITTGSGSSVNLINGANTCNVFWRVGSSATLGTNSSFLGTIIAQASVTLTTGAELTGRALALAAAVTMDTNNVSVVPACVQPTPPGPGPGNNNDQNTAQGPGAAPAITQDKEQEAESGEVTQTFDVS